MDRPPLLSQGEIDQQLKGLPGWERKGQTITKLYVLPTFMDGLGLVNRVGQAAETADHHPDITINYQRVRFTLHTWHTTSVEGLTNKDFDLARQIDRIAAELP